MAVTRDQLAVAAEISLGQLGADLSRREIGSNTEGSYTEPINAALRDCGWSSVSEATTVAQERALYRGTEYYALRIVLRNLLSKARTQHGAGASQMHLMVDWESNVRATRLHVNDTLEQYQGALAAIGRGLNLSPSGSADDLVVLIDDDDSDSLALIDDTYGLPWFAEGYHELDT